MLGVGAGVEDKLAHQVRQLVDLVVVATALAVQVKEQQVLQILEAVLAVADFLMVEFIMAGVQVDRG